MFLGLLSVQNEARSETVVRVLAYSFPPFLNEDLKTGLTPDLISLLNETQDEFRFELKVSSPNRRFKSLASQDRDMVLFEMPQWGWSNVGVDFSTSREIMTGGEVYITSAQMGRDQSFFEAISGKTISAHYGYHYGFAEFNSDREWLQNNFRIGLHNSHYRIIDFVSKNKTEIGVVTLSFLKQYLKNTPDKAKQIVISEKFDQIYSLPALIRKGAPISVMQLEKILNSLKESGKLQALFKENGLLDQLTY